METYTFTSGTLSFASTPALSGTVWLGGYRPLTTPEPPAPNPNEVRADALIERWKDGKGRWKKLRKLIVDALDEAVEEALDD